ncbi:Xaa-Pro aminopeptidase 1 [Homalodisca vitripennis]|nr:Xaa-Pro aminopeptidase 1 [Homalodisca vitripennis]
MRLKEYFLKALQKYEITGNAVDNVETNTKKNDHGLKLRNLKHTAAKEYIVNKSKALSKFHTIQHGKNGTIENTIIVENLNKFFAKHDLILTKQAILSGSKIRELVASYLEGSYLEQLAELQIMNGKKTSFKSNFQPSVRGVPQGSDLCSFLTTHKRGKSIATSQDVQKTTPHYNKNLPYLLTKMKQAENEALKWFSSNKLLCNQEKTQNIILSLSNNTQDVQSAKLLGIHIDSKLNWSHHIYNLCSRLSRDLHSYNTRNRDKLDIPQHRLAKTGSSHMVNSIVFFNKLNVTAWTASTGVFKSKVEKARSQRYVVEKTIRNLIENFDILRVGYSEKKAKLGTLEVRRARRKLRIEKEQKDKEREGVMLLRFSETCVAHYRQNSKTICASATKFLRVTQDTYSCNVNYNHKGVPGTPKLEAWLSKELPKGSRIGVDPQLVTLGDWRIWSAELHNFNHSLVPVTTNLVDRLWADRPSPPNAAIVPHPLKFSGQISSEKVANVRTKMEEKGTSVLVVTALDEIAWLLNLRGADVPCNPVFYAYVVITMSEVHIFIDNMRVTPAVTSHFATEKLQVTIHPYEEIFQFIEDLVHGLPADEKYWITHTTSYSIASLIPENSRISDAAPIAAMKAIKNPVEAEGMINAHVRDGAALISYFAWLEKELAKGTVVTEISGATKLEEFRKSLIYETITETLVYRKLSARWIPKQLTEQHKLNRAQSSKEFLERYELEGEIFLTLLLLETKLGLPTTHLKLRRGSLSNGVIPCHPLPRNLKPQFQKKKKTFGWDVLNHPQYFPDLVPSDFYHFPEGAHEWKQVFNRRGGEGGGGEMGKRAGGRLLRG